jgi:uncharacterized caspase-like protein
VCFFIDVAHAINNVLSEWPMLEIVRTVLLCALLIAGMTDVARAEKRVALVIGNGAYEKVSRLPNPAQDASAIEGMLKAAGFDVVQRATDLNAVTLRRALRDFSDQVREADIAVVFYAGHGIEVNGANYLIPIDAVLERDIDVEDEAVSLDRVGQILEQAKRLRLVILDACRDNPFVRSMKRTIGSRSIGRGLAKIEIQSSDTLVAYAAKAGSTAADGDGANSPYTTALIKHLATPGLDIRLALGRIRDDVLRATSNRQEPFVYGSLGGAEIPLVPGDARTSSPPPVVKPPTNAGTSEARRMLDLVQGTRDKALLETLANQYRGQVVGKLAGDRLEQLRRGEHSRAAQVAVPRGMFYSKRADGQSLSSSGGLIGATVHGPTGDALGKITQIILERGSVAGFVFMYGEKPIAVRMPSPDVTVDKGNQNVRLGIQEHVSVLATLPAYVSGCADVTQQQCMADASCNWNTSTGKGFCISR